MDSRKCQTVTVSPAKPGGFPLLDKDDLEILVFECVPILSEPMFAANQGRFPADGSKQVELVRIRGNESDIGSESIAGTVVGQLRYEYALNLLHRLGHHLSRVGLNFKTFPKTDDGLG